MTPKAQPSRGAIFVRFIFMALCCTLSAAFAIHVRQLTRGQILATTSVSVSIGLFAILLFVAGLLGTRGKHSESWAFLAYGSWMTIPGLALFNIVLLRTHMALVDWVGLALPAYLFVFFVCVGLRAALQDKWTQVFLWWVASLPPLFAFMSIALLFLGSRLAELVW